MRPTEKRSLAKKMIRMTKIKSSFRKTMTSLKSRSIVWWFHTLLSKLEAWLVKVQLPLENQIQKDFYTHRNSDWISKNLSKDCICTTSVTLSHAQDPWTGTRDTFWYLKSETWWENYCGQLAVAVPSHPLHKKSPDRFRGRKRPGRWVNGVLSITRGGEWAIPNE